MNIAMLCVHTSPLASLGGKKTGGMNVYVRDLCRELGRRGIHVDVFTRVQDEDTPRIQSGGDNFRVINVPAGTSQPLHPTKVEPHLDQFADNVVAFADEEGMIYDIIHAHYWLSGIAAAKLPTRWNRPVPIIQMFHTLGALKNQIAPTANHRAPQSRIDSETKIVQQIADHLIVATPTGKEQLINFYEADPEKIVIIPPGTDTQRFAQIPQHDAKRQLGLQPDQKMVLLIGRIEPLKGIDTLLEAAHIIKQKHDARFVIVGGNLSERPPTPEMSRLLALCDELKLEDVVDFVGAKAQDELPVWYSAADIVAMPSHYESFGLVALEAMMMGTPVVASRVGGLQHLVKDGETGFLIEARSAEQLADRLDLLLTDDNLCQQLGKQAHKHAQSYSWPQVADQIVALYNNLS